MNPHLRSQVCYKKGIVFQKIWLIIESEDVFQLKLDPLVLLKMYLEKYGMKEWL